MSYILFELARHQDIQEKVRNEVNTISAKYGDSITYESLQEMPYLEACFFGKILYC